MAIIMKIEENFPADAWLSTANSINFSISMTIIAIEKN